MSRFVKKLKTCISLRSLPKSRPEHKGINQFVKEHCQKTYQPIFVYSLDALPEKKTAELIVKEGHLWINTVERRITKSISNAGYKLLTINSSLARSSSSVVIRLSNLLAEQ
jgi:hypothetical protein